MKKIFTLLSLMLTVMAANAQSPVTVSVTEDEVTASTTTLTFTANEGTASYYVCQFEAGTLEEQFAMWSMFMGFQTPGEMVKAWGIECTGTTTHTWKDLVPSTAYDYYIQSIGEDGEMLPLEYYTVTTKGQGGSEPAVISISVGEFMEAEGKTWQRVIFEPNEDTERFYDYIITDEGYQEAGGAEGVKADLMSLYDDPVMRDPAAFFATDNDFWNVEEGVTYHAVAVGLNGAGEWGELCEYVFVAGDATGVKGISTVKADDQLYDLMGRRVNEAVPGRVYIQNGKAKVAK